MAGIAVDANVRLGTDWQPPNYYDVTVYGAKGNGIDDDTQYVQACFDAAKLESGAVVYFPAGTYIVSQLLIDNTTPLKIYGVYTSGDPRPDTWTSIVKQKANSPGTLFKGNVGGCHNLEIRYLEFDGDHANQYHANHAISTYTTGMYVGQCYMHDFYWGPDGSAWLTGKSFSSQNSHDAVMEDCTVVRCGNGFQPMDGAYDCTIRNTFFDQQYSITGEGSEQITFYRDVVNCRAYDCVLTDSYQAIQLDGAVDCVIDGCTIYDSVGYFFIIGDQGTTSGNVVNDCHFTMDPAYTNVGLKVGDDVSDTTVTGCTFDDFTTVYYYPMRIQSDCVVDDCHFTNCHPVSFEASDIEFKNSVIEDGLENGTRIYSLSAISNLVFTGNTFKNCQRAGFMLSSAGAVSNVTLSGNEAFNNGQWIAGVYSGFQFSTPVSNLVINGNHGYDDQTPKTQLRGVDVVNGSSGTYDSYNDMTGNLAAPYWDGLTPS